MSVANRDKRAIVFPAKRLADLGFDLLATSGTAGVLRRAGVPVEAVAKVSESPSDEKPNVAELIRAGRVDLVINTPFGRGPRTDGYHIRTAAAAAGVPCLTTMPGAFAAVRGIEALRVGPTEPMSIQEHHAGARARPVQEQLGFEVRPRPRAREGSGVKRVRAEVLSTRKVGAYHQLTVVAPGDRREGEAGAVRRHPDARGQGVPAPAPSAIHDASRRGGWAGTLEFVVDPAGPGRSWLASSRAHSFLDMIGPLGKGFAHPRHLTNCLLVAERHGAATLYFLAQELVAAGKRVDMVIGAETLERVLKPIDAKRLSQTVAIVTADGTLGDRGGVMDALPEAAERSKAQVVYAAGPRPHAGADRRVLQGARAARRRWRSRNGWDAASGCARPASCRSRARTAAATTTSAPASTARSSTRLASCGTDGSAERAHDAPDTARRPAGRSRVAGLR